ncbi:histidine kinase [Flavobacterium sp. FZUC8N2.13]|uniref:Histidine kinase n=1 Tax=Flavobacterium zubiriense TaxID=3138075 RepID=A0ABV4T979_9FLAO
MKNKFLILIFLLLSNISFSQKLFNNVIEDTLSIEEFGNKVELENDLNKSEKLNNILIDEIIKRRKIKTVPLKIQLFYENAYLATLINKAYFANKKGDFKKEIAIYYKVLKNITTRTDPRYIGFTYSAIGMSFAEIKEYEKSIFYCKKSLYYLKKSNNASAISSIYNNLGQLYSRINRLEQALFYLKQSEIYGKDCENTSILGSTYNDMASVYYKKEDYVKAIESYEKGIQISTKAKDNFQLSILYFNSADAFQKIGNTQKFEAYKIKSFQFADSSKNLTVLKNAGKDLSQIFKNKNDFKKALFYFEKSNAAKDTLEKEDNKNAILKAEFKFDNEKKEAQIKALHQDKKIARLNNEKQKNLMLILSFLFISILSTICILFNRFKIKKQNEYLKSKLEEAEKTILAEKKASQSELKAFKSQMNPHFFYNALNTVQSYILTNDKKLAISYLSKFSILTRSILEMTEKESISIADEIKTLTLYLDIEKARFNEDFEYSIQIENIDDTELTKIPSMFLQPYVENAIKHGLLHKEGRKELKINFTIENQVIVIQIEDNGIGREKSMQLNAIKNKNHTSFATEAIQNRIDILNKMRAKPIQLTFTDKKNSYQHALGTVVNIEIPL